ncbi:MAG: chloride channel protein [bacterium]
MILYKYIWIYLVKWISLSIIVGIGGGFSTYLLKELIKKVTKISVYFPLWSAPIVGGLLVSVIYIWDRYAEGFGTNHYINSVNSNDGFLKFKTYLSKIVSSAFTLGFQGSGGYEGPLVMIGGSLGSVISRIPLVRNIISREDIRILTICGAAGALGAIFHSPLGAGIFVVEVLYRSTLHYPELFPAILSSTMGYIIYSRLGSAGPLFKIPEVLPELPNVPWFILTGVLAGLAALLFMDLFDVIRVFFKEKKYSYKGYNLNPAIGGILTGLLMFLLPQVGGTGLNFIQEMITGHLNFLFILILIIAKILATSFTVGSGGSAGLVIPSLFIGALSGNMLVGIIGSTNAGFNISLIIAGMAASFASIANVPVAAAVMLIEMTGLQLGAPIVLGSVVGYTVAHRRIIYNTTYPDLGEFEQGKICRKKDRYMEM